jgi:hypothetical protein
MAPNPLDAPVTTMVLDMVVPFSVLRLLRRQLAEFIDLLGGIAGIAGLAGKCQLDHRGGKLMIGPPLRIRAAISLLTPNGPRILVRIIASMSELGWL